MEAMEYTHFKWFCRFNFVFFFFTVDLLNIVSNRSELREQIESMLLGERSMSPHNHFWYVFLVISYDVIKLQFLFRYSPGPGKNIA